MSLFTNCTVVAVGDNAADISVTDSDLYGKDGYREKGVGGRRGMERGEEACIGAIYDRYRAVVKMGIVLFVPSSAGGSVTAMYGIQFNGIQRLDEMMNR